MNDFELVQKIAYKAGVNGAPPNPFYERFDGYLTAYLRGRVAAGLHPQMSIAEYYKATKKA